METTELNMINIIKNLKMEQELLTGNFGLEKENIRVNIKGELVLTPHPKAFGDKMKNQYITTDFSESQVEMITPIASTIEETYNFLENIHDIITLELKEEYLWPQSAPPVLPDDAQIPIAQYGDSKKGKEAMQYRKALTEKYGKKKQLISGIHYNFSFKEELLLKIYKAIGTSKSFTLFKNDVYLKISRNFLRYSWLIIYLFGASPGTHNSYCKQCVDRMVKTANGDPYFEYATSMRNGICGYRNKNNYIVSYNSIEEYVSEMTALITNGDIQDSREYYSPIRLKTKDNKDTLNALIQEGIEYLEIRVLDLNPLYKLGIDIDTMYFMHLFLLFCLFSEEEVHDKELHDLSLLNNEYIASSGHLDGLKLRRTNEEEILVSDWAHEVLDEMLHLVDALGIKKEYFNNLIIEAKDKIDKKIPVPSKIILEGIKQSSYLDFHMEKTNKYLDYSKSKQFNLKGYEDLELSTQILLKDAIKRGLSYEIIDRNENFIVLDNGVKREYIKQATKTSLDAYIAFLIMENKLVTKKVLEKKNIRVPKGEAYNSKEEALKNYNLYKDGAIVIKPKSTNFGIGITIFKQGFSRELYETAIELAFEHDQTILVEEFIEGKEYRIFVIGDEVVGILHRVPANVKGDGQHSIKVLVEEKNKNPLRGKGYRTPLEKIALGKVEEMFLLEQGKTFDYIPSKDEIVYLRENSNVSTGGDSIDYTDDISDEYKSVAVAAAQAVGASICGVDMVIRDTQHFERQNYGIIELNFNPAIHIHCYPYIGKNRKLGEKILNALGF